MSPDEKTVKPISAFLSMIGLVVILATCLQVLKLPTRGTLVLCIVYLSVVTYFLGNSLEEIENYLLDGFKKAAFTVGVLMAVGCVIGGWITGTTTAAGRSGFYPHFPMACCARRCTCIQITFQCRAMANSAPTTKRRVCAYRV